MTIFLLISIWFAITVGVTNLWTEHKAQESREELYKVLDQHIKLHREIVPEIEEEEEDYRQ